MAPLIKYPRDIHSLYLHIAQLRMECERALTRKYHSPKVNQFINENIRLIDYILTNNDEAKLKADINFFYLVLTVIDRCHSFIVSSTTDDVRSEMFSCLRFVLKEWIPDPEHYVIVCSQGSYAFMSYGWNNDDAFDHIESETSFVYGIRMIPITMPFHMQGDFMFNAALYHEIGHFVDCYHKYTSSIIEKVRKGKLVIPQSDVYLKDMTKDLATSAEDYYKQLTSFLKEYLADLFAAKYTGKSIFYYLKYVNPRGLADEEHPSIEDREKVIDEFLGDPKDYSEFLKTLISDVKDVNDSPLRPITLNTDISSFVQITECDKPESEKHVHSIIPNLWDIWNNRRGEFKNPDSTPMHFIEVYRSLMDLTAKAIQKLQ